MMEAWGQSPGTRGVEGSRALVADRPEPSLDTHVVASEAFPPHPVLGSDLQYRPANTLQSGRKTTGTTAERTEPRLSQERRSCLASSRLSPGNSGHRLSARYPVLTLPERLGDNHTFHPRLPAPAPETQCWTGWTLWPLLAAYAFVTPSDTPATGQSL